MPAAIKDKLAHAAQKYPAAHFKDKSDADKRANWLKARQSYRAAKKGL
jgi:hypothetical protein